MRHHAKGASWGQSYVVRPDTSSLAPAKSVSQSCGVAGDFGRAGLVTIRFDHR
jgi:hypothetical protein